MECQIPVLGGIKKGPTFHPVTQQNPIPVLVGAKKGHASGTIIQEDPTENVGFQIEATATETNHPQPLLVISSTVRGKGGGEGVVPPISSLPSMLPAADSGGGELQLVPVGEIYGGFRVLREMEGLGRVKRRWCGGR
jgi:hypothetical protein